MSSGKQFHIEVSPRDPLIARDGRPFSAGSRMKSLEWIYPSVVAGSLRSMVGKAEADGFTDELCQKLRAIEMRGPLPLVDGELYLPAPKDISVPRPDAQISRSFFTARPVRTASGYGTDLPHQLCPVLLDLSSEEDDFKPGHVADFWSASQLARWLAAPDGQDFAYEPSKRGFVRAPIQDQRMHVQITPASGTATESMLFSSSGLDLSYLPTDEFPDGFGREMSLVLTATDAGNLIRGEADATGGWHPLGGERRLANWRVMESSEDSLWTQPGSIDLTVAPRYDQRALVRMVLVTPGLFDSGWHPDWLSAADEDQPLTGKVPETDVQVQLVGACVDRWKPISGWSYEQGSRGPKPARRLVPAGSVYFFEVLEGQLAALGDRWLQPTYANDDPCQAARDGFGLAAWGVWQYHDWDK